MNSFAIIETGGKQYKVAPGQKLKVERLEVKAGEKFLFDKVLLHINGTDVKIGMPHVSLATVEAKVLREGRERKKIIFKYHSKTRQRRTKGHRQYFTEVEIVKI